MPLKRAGARLKDAFGKYDVGHDTEE